MTIFFFVNQYCVWLLTIYKKCQFYPNNRSSRSRFPSFLYRSVFFVLGFFRGFLLRNAIYFVLTCMNNFSECVQMVSSASINQKHMLLCISKDFALYASWWVGVVLIHLVCWTPLNSSFLPLFPLVFHTSIIFRLLIYKVCINVKSRFLIFHCDPQSIHMHKQSIMKMLPKIIYL